MLLNYHLTVVDAEIESESVLNVWVGVDHLEVCPLSTAEMLPLDQRNDCQVSLLAPHFPLCQQTNVPVRCWDTKIEIFLEILRHLRSHLHRKYDSHSPCVCRVACSPSYPARSSRRFPSSLSMLTLKSQLGRREGRGEKSWE